MLNTKWRSICGVVLLVCLVEAVNSQGKPKWLGDVERSLQREGWKETRKNTYIDSKTKKFVSVSVLLENNETHASIVIGQQGSVSEARDQFRSLLLAYKVTKKEATVNKYVGLGDENVAVGGEGWVKITFRKGRVITDVLPSPEETAERVARLVAAAIPGKN